MNKRQAKKIIKNKDKFQYKQVQIKKAEAHTSVVNKPTEKEVKSQK